MKKILVAGLLCLVFTTCEKPILRSKVRDTDCSMNYASETISKGMICNTELCDRYYAIWKEIFMQRNDISEKFFNDHIKVLSSDIYDIQLNGNYNICYSADIDWASVMKCDNFIIKLNVADKALDPLIPRNQFLTKEQIKSVLNVKPETAYASRINLLSNREDLQFISREDALQALAKKFGVSQLCPVYFYVNPMGHIMMEARANFTGTDKCIFVTVDLETGEASQEEDFCLKMY